MSLLTKLPRPLYAATAFEDFIADPGFRLGTAKAMAWLSQLAYETDEPEKIKSVLSDWDLGLVDVVSAEVSTVLPIASTRAFVATRRDATFIAFAGTDPFVLANWISDFDVHLTSTGAAQGYAEAAAIVRQKLNGLVAESGEKRLFITGHSLGGALAIVTAAGPFKAADGVYTFGGPRPGNDAFAGRYDEMPIGMRTYRLVYADDIVPTVAPTELGFRHVGRYLHCMRGVAFDESKLAPDTQSDDPFFADGEADEIRTFFSSSLSAAGSAAGRLRSAADAVSGGLPAGVRTDPAGVLQELLPQRLRDHALKGYCAALPG